MKFIFHKAHPQYIVPYKTIAAAKKHSCENLVDIWEIQDFYRWKSQKAAFLLFAFHKTHVNVTTDLTPL